MWSFNGKKFTHVYDPIKFYEGERVRLTLINNTMMPHPIHLHGMFFDVVNGSKNHKPRKHTMIVKPGEKQSWDISAEHVGDWAFHCHLFFHMLAGMFQVVTLLPKDPNNPKMDHSMMDHSKMNHGETRVDHSNMDHSKMKMDMDDMGEMDHSKMDHGDMEGTSK